jgi:UDP-N-acetylglucosamine--N-acetylmuramyl-(pentapeptide) pyrophosphoryl-undecaprenol N-acetylglucosamine transferase
MTRLVLCGGGTGGHIYPALAIAGSIRGRWPETEILYIGGAGGMESRIVPQAGWPFQGITAKGWQGRNISALPQALQASYRGRQEALEILSRFKPRAVVGTGGFVCLPVAAAAVQKRIPVYLHEQNAFPGIANRFISLWAEKIMVSFEEAAGRFPPNVRKRVAVTGLPVRADIAGAAREEALAFFHLQEGKKTILATGGSQGAKSINRAMLHVVKRLYRRPEVQVLLAAGARDYEQMAGELQKADIPWAPEDGERGRDSNIRMLPYIDRMDLAYKAAQLFVGRAGASTLAEITLCRLPAILIPYPYAAENHQAYNAASLRDKGAALVLEDERLTGPLLLERLEEILGDDDKRQAMAESSYKAAHGRALEDILDILQEIIEG